MLRRICLITWLVAASVSVLAQGQARTGAAAGGSTQEAERTRKRDEWQRPAEVLNALGAKPGQRIADIGSGYGYFTFHLAARVGVEGKVYAVDVDEKALDQLRQRKQREQLTQVEPILGASADPRLPGGLDAVLIVDAYHEFREYERTMQAIWLALKPGGRLVLIDGEGPSGKPRTEYHRLHVIPAELVREEVARVGFVFKESRPGFYDAEYGKRMYFLIFEKPGSQSANDGERLAIGDAAPDWRLKTAAGKTITLEELRGNVVVLDFWAEWCGPCRKLEPVFNQLTLEYRHQPVRFFTLSIRPGPDFNPQAYLKEHQLASTFLIGDEGVDRNYGIWGLPTYFVIDPTGRIAYRHVLLKVDAAALGRQLRAAIEDALPGEQGALEVAKTP
jgi:predicted methyltransferase/thiol-disulfide isomerase/thioredoxin